MATFDDAVEYAKRKRNEVGKDVPDFHDSPPTPEHWEEFVAKESRDYAKKLEERVRGTMSDEEYQKEFLGKFESIPDKHPILSAAKTMQESLDALSNQARVPKKLLGAEHYWPPEDQQNFDPFKGNEYHDYNAATGETMSSKFLPFITESSNLNSVFKALVQRSKGVSSRDLGIIYTALLKFGIDKIKTFVDTLPSNLSANDVFSNIITNYKQHEIPINEMNYWGCVLLNYGLTNVANKNGYSSKELSVYFAVIASVKPQSLININFIWDVELLTKFSPGSYDCMISEMPHIKFSPDAKKIGFITACELKAFIASWLSEGNEGMLEFMPVLIDIPFGDVTDEDYKNRNCQRPYNSPESSELPKAEARPYEKPESANNEATF